MLDSLSAKLTDILNRLKKKGKLSKGDVEEGLREVRLALLEADVNYKVAKRFAEQVVEKALGEEVLESLTPGQQLIKIVRDELTNIMGRKQAELELDGSPAVIMLVGLQGSGKTTTAGKLAKHLVKINRVKRPPLLVATDVYRPAAIEQLEQLGEQLGFPTFSVAGSEASPVEIAKDALSYAQQNRVDLVILDTAGRLQIDEPMMEELVLMKARLNPSEILLVADAMTGQEAVNIAQEFNHRLELTGIILTKLDGDARGGAALSMVEITKKPIKFIGVGEKLDDLEVFHPDRMAQRILGMGDILGLIEEAEARIDASHAEALERKLREDRFTLQDFLDQLKEVRSLGPLDRLIEKLPGMGRIEVEGRELDKIEAVINSMTMEERLNPGMVDGSRKKRIARGSGTHVRDVNRLLKQFNQAKRLMKQMGKMKLPLKDLPF